ncbi:MAG: hypothetical protein ACFFCU_00160 [Promethearchaeota archaeon]
MKKRNKNATRVTVSTFGVILGIAGVEHGIGEILQGNIAPSGIMIESWPNSDLYEILSGEPAVTIIPNILLTGVLAILMSLILIIWAIKFIQTKHGGSGFIFLSFIFLLVGGGLAGPLLIGITIGLAATRINSQFKWWNDHVSVEIRRGLSKIWPYSYVACVIGWFSLWPGVIILVYFSGFQNSLLVYISALFSFTTLLLTIFSGFSFDSFNNVSKNKQIKSEGVVIHV